MFNIFKGYWYISIPLLILTAPILVIIAVLFTITFTILNGVSIEHEDQGMSRF